MARTKKNAEAPVETVAPEAPAAETTPEAPTAPIPEAPGMEQAAEISIRMEDGEVLQVTLPLEHGNNLMRSLDREVGKVTLNIEGRIENINVKHVARATARAVLVPAGGMAQAPAPAPAEGKKSRKK